MFGRIKLQPNDALYSKIIRWGKNACDRCGGNHQLQCAHIMGRAHKGTRWMLYPVRNAIALCMSCHAWFDSHKITAVIVEPEKRVFKPNEEGFTFLVKGMGYSWAQLLRLYVLSQAISKPDEKIVEMQLKLELNRLERGSPPTQTSTKGGR